MKPVVGVMPLWDDERDSLWMLPGRLTLPGLLSQHPSKVDLHQAVGRLASGLESMACVPDGLIEAVFPPGKRFLWVVQWHPELSYKTDEYSRRIFRDLIDAMK